MTGHRVRAVAVVWLVAAAVVLTGCSEPQQPSTSLPSPREYAPIEPTTSALPPLGPPDLPMPEAARAQTPDGAQAFLGYYMDIYSHAQRAMDSSYMREFSQNCQSCDRIADDIDMDSAAGYQYQGGEMRVDDVSPPLVNGTEAQLAFNFTQAALAVTLGGVVVEELAFPENTGFGSGAILFWDSPRSSWLLTQWDVQ